MESTLCYEKLVALPQEGNRVNSKLLLSHGRRKRGPMTESITLHPRRWLALYKEAFRQPGEIARRQQSLSTALTACHRWLFEMSPERSSEREESSTAIEDLKILESLYKKYG